MPVHLTYTSVHLLHFVLLIELHARAGCYSIIIHFKSCVNVDSGHNAICVHCMLPEDTGTRPPRNAQAYSVWSPPQVHPFRRLRHAQGGDDNAKVMDRVKYDCLQMQTAFTGVVAIAATPKSPYTPVRKGQGLILGLSSTVLGLLFSVVARIEGRIFGPGTHLGTVCSWGLSAVVGLRTAAPGALSWEASCACCCKIDWCMCSSNCEVGFVHSV